MRKLLTFAAIAAMLTLTSCASGAKRTLADTPIPDITIAQTQMQEPAPLPDLVEADDDALLRNHVAVARLYHDLSDQVRALLCSVTTQQGYTVNGAPPVPLPWCEGQSARGGPP